MEIQGSTVLILGGSGLVGRAVARRLLRESPARVVLGSLREEDARQAAEDLEGEFPGASVEAVWGDLFVPEAFRERSTEEVLSDPDGRRLLIDDLYGELTDDVFQRSSLGTLLREVRPGILVDCVNTAGALAYRNVFSSADALRHAADAGGADREAVERHLATLYMPRLIRHAQIALEGMKRAGTRIYVKIGTSGTGGMGLNIPFTHSEERPSRVLLSKAGLAGAHTLLLYLMARTPGAPAVKEIKPTAAISWKSIGYGPITRGGRPIYRSDAVGAVPVKEAFGENAEESFRETGEPLKGVYLDAGENGYFSTSEFETITSLGLMEYVTPEEIAQNVFWEISSHPTGKDVVAALDGATMGPTYRAGALRNQALHYMEELEEETGVTAVAYEMLGPPRLSKLLFEARLLELLYRDLDTAAELDPGETAARTGERVEEDQDLRQRMLSVGIPVLLPDGESLLRGAQVWIHPDEGRGVDDRVVDRGWVDLRPGNWERWRDRIRDLREEVLGRPGPELGSQADYEYGDAAGRIRPGRLAAWIFRYEDEGERIKR